MPTFLRVLIVEDTPDDAELMTLQLTVEGFQADWTRVQTEADYLTALAASPDLILADWSLPQFSGLRALQLMQARGLDIPLVIVSGSVGEEIAIDALRQGAYDYVLKDRPARLGQAVRRALDEKRLRKERQQAQEALRESEARYRAFMNASADLAFVKDDQLRYIMVNDAMAAFCQRAPADILGRTDAELLPSAMAAGCLASDQQTIRKQAVVVTEEPVDGRFFETTKFPVPLAGGKTGIGGTVRDITERKQAEAALQESEARYRRLTDNARDIIFRYSLRPEMRLTYINPAVQEITGYTPEECYADPNLILNLAHPDDAPMMAGFVGALAPPDKSLLMRWIGKDGVVRWMESRIVQVYDAAGQIVAVEGITRDMTERRRAEEELHRANAFLDSVIENIPDMVFLKDARNLQFVRFNRAGEELLGQSKGDLLGKNDYDFFPQEQADFFTAKDRAVLGQKNVMDIAEELIQTRDKGVLTLHTKKVPVLNALGEPEYLLGISEDITARKQVEAEREHLLTQIQAQARQLAQVMYAVPEGVLLLDATGRVLLANPRAEDDLAVLAGVWRGDILLHLGDHTLAELLNPPPEGLWHEVHAAGCSYEIVAKPIENGSGLESWVLVLRDVTQERDVQQQALQQERLAAVGQLAAGIAHDFNNILAVIALQARLALAASDQASPIYERLATISGQAQRAADLVKQILDFSRQAVLERRPMALRPFLADQIALLARTLPESIALELTGTEDDCTVSADPTRLQQVVMNLAVNARDAMPEGGRLRFTLEHVSTLPSDLQSQATAAEDVAAWVRLMVADSGMGIPPEVLPRIFEPFFTTKGPGKGSGLGLSQIHGIIKQHGGEISVGTQVGVGTTFILYLPALADSAAIEPMTVADEAPAAAGQTILIVEDDLTLRDALMDTVDLLGYRTLSAADGREALTMLAQHEEIALIMSDLVMPEMGGRALLQELKQRGVTVPVVILSGHPLDDELGSLQALGLTGWLLKPPEIDQLARLLAQALPAHAPEE